MATTKDSWLKRADLTVSNIIFYLLFWGVHVAIFAVGWFVVTLIKCSNCANTATGICKQQIPNWQL